MKVIGTGEILIKFKMVEKCQGLADLQTKEETEKSIKDMVKEICEGCMEEAEIEVKNIEIKVEE